MLTLHIEKSFPSAEVLARSLRRIAKMVERGYQEESRVWWLEGEEVEPIGYRAVVEITNADGDRRVLTCRCVSRTESEALELFQSVAAPRGYRLRRITPVYPPSPRLGRRMIRAVTLLAASVVVGVGWLVGSKAAIVAWATLYFGVGIKAAYQRDDAWIAAGLMLILGLIGFLWLYP